MGFLVDDQSSRKMTRNARYPKAPPGRHTNRDIHVVGGGSISILYLNANAPNKFSD